MTQRGVIEKVNTTRKEFALHGGRLKRTATRRDRIGGFELVRAADGHEALQRFRQQPINIAPLDFEHSAGLKCDELPEELRISMKQCRHTAFCDDGVVAGKGRTFLIAATKCIANSMRRLFRT
jgi:hypothetical protein